MRDGPLTDCPECGKAQLGRLVSAAAFRLKGGGWYETDFKKDGKRNLHDSNAPKTDKGDASGGEKKEPSKAAEKKTASTDSAASKPSAA